jgi:hypothetical protein
VAVARENQKGRVERAIRTIRSSFFAARQWQDIDDLNAQADRWCEGVNANRPWPQDTAMTVREAFAQEQPQLLTLPDNPFPTDDRVEVSAGKTPYVRFDLNDYSIPHSHVRQTLTVVASLTQVRVLDGIKVIAQHNRSYAKAEQIEDPTHIQALIAYKHHAREHSGKHRLAHAVPDSLVLIQQAVERGNRPGSVVSLLLELLDRYGASELQSAIAEVLQRQVPHPEAVRQALERRREQRNKPPPITIPLPHNSKAKNTVVRPGSLADYDQLKYLDSTTGSEPEDAPVAPQPGNKAESNDNPD